MAERFILAIRLPFPVGCFVVAFLLGPPSQVFWRYLNTGDIFNAYDDWMRAVLPTQLDWVVYLATYSSLGYAFLATWYMRRKLVQAKGALSEILSNGENDFHRFFGPISAVRPQIILWALAFAFNIGLYLRTFLAVYPGGPVLRVVYFTTFELIISLGGSAGVWVYFCILRGIHRMGQAELQLRSFQVDPLLGLRPVGALAFSLSFIYFGATLLTFLGNITSGTLVFLIVLLGNLVFGWMMFFVPMLRFHNTMAQLKHQEKDKLSHRLRKLVVEPKDSGQPQPNMDVLYLDMMERRASSISTWPFDTKILGRLVAVVSTVLGILLSLLSLR